MSGGPTSGDDGESLWAGEAYETYRRELAEALGNRALTWGEAIARVEQLADEDRRRRADIASLTQPRCGAREHPNDPGSDSCDKPRGHSGAHRCDDPIFSWGGR